MSRFRSIVLDVDSTLCGVEGIDWLATRRSGEVAKRIAELTDRAMNGEMTLDAVYGMRLDLIRPTRAEIAALADHYIATVAPGALQAIKSFQRAGMRVVLVSGGVRPAIEPIARSLGVELQAVDVWFAPNGEYAGYDSSSPLTTQAGKRDVVAGVGLSRPTVAVGDGATDVAMRPAVDAFVAYTGFVRRERVVSEADAEVSSFAGLLEYVLRSSPTDPR